MSRGLGDVYKRQHRHSPGLMLQPIQAERPPEAPSHGDLNLLEAITHEVRTPLATIRTLIRSLLRLSLIHI